MDLQLRKYDKLRIIAGKGIEDVFIDCSFISNSSDTNYNECLSSTAYEMHQVFILRKERIIKVFSFRKDDVVYQSDFGFWSDGEIIFTNSKAIKEQLTTSKEV